MNFIWEVAPGAGQLRATILILGIVCIIAAIVGGGLTAFGIKVPIIPSLPRQIELSLFGGLLILVALGPSWPSACPFQGDNDTRTLINLINAEGTAANTQDLLIISEIFDPRATITDAVSGMVWNNPVTRYTNMFKDPNGDVRSVVHFEFRVVKEDSDGKTAWVTSGNTGKIVTSDTSKDFRNDPGSDHWLFQKNRSGCWAITDFTFNANHLRFPP